MELSIYLTRKLFCSSLIALFLASCFTAPQFGLIPQQLTSISFSLFKILQPGLSWDFASMTISLQVSHLGLSDKFSTRGIVHDRQTRYRDSLNIPSCRINAGQRAFCYCGVKIWNNLSKDLREIINAKVFKRRLINELI